MIRSPIVTAGSLLLLAGLFLLPAPTEAAEQARRGVPVSLDQASGPDIRVSLNKLSFRNGEEARVTVQASEPVYVHVFSVARDGTVTALLPNRIARGNLVTPGQDLVFPSESLQELGVRLKVWLPKDSLQTVEEIRGVATRDKINLLKGDSLDGVFFLTGPQGGEYLKAVREKLNALGPDNWSEVSLSYEVRK